MIFKAKLIPEGWIKKQGQRYYKATEKLLNYAFLPEEIKLTEEQRRFLSLNTKFFRKDLVELFENEQIVGL